MAFTSYYRGKNAQRIRASNNSCYYLYPLAFCTLYYQLKSFCYVSH